MVHSVVDSLYFNKTETGTCYLTTIFIKNHRVEKGYSIS